MDHVRSVGSTRWARSMSSRAAVRPAPETSSRVGKYQDPPTGGLPDRDGMTSTTADVPRLLPPPRRPLRLRRRPRLADADWDALEPCEGWSARDVLAHVVSSQREFLAQHGIDASTSPTSTRPLDRPGGRVARPRRAGARAARRPGRRGMEYDGVFGRTTVGRVDRRRSTASTSSCTGGTSRWPRASTSASRRRARHARAARPTASATTSTTTASASPPWPLPTGADRQERVLARLGRRDADDRLSGQRAQRYSTSGRPAPAYRDRRTATLVSQRYSA